MKRLTILVLLATASAWSQPQDAIATANAEAVDATAIARMVHLVQTAMETSAPRKSAEVMVDSYVLALSGAEFPRNATGTWSATATVDLSVGWQLIQAMAAQVSYMAIRNAFNSGNNPEGIDQDVIEWGMLAAPTRIPSATTRALLRDYHERALNPIVLE